MTTHGPIGPKPRLDLPSQNRPPAANCSARSLTSCPTVRPATKLHASASATRVRRLAHRRRRVCLQTTSARGVRVAAMKKILVLLVVVGLVALAAKKVRTV